MLTLGDFKQLNGLFSFGFPWVMQWYGEANEDSSEGSVHTFEVHFWFLKDCLILSTGEIPPTSLEFMKICKKKKKHSVFSSTSKMFSLYA